MQVAIRKEKLISFSYGEQGRLELLDEILSLSFAVLKLCVLHMREVIQLNFILRDISSHLHR